MADRASWLPSLFFAAALMSDTAAGQKHPKPVEDKPKPVTKEFSTQVWKKFESSACTADNHTARVSFSVYPSVRDMKIWDHQPSPAAVQKGIDQLWRKTAAHLTAADLGTNGPSEKFTNELNTAADEFRKTSRFLTNGIKLDLSTVVTYKIPTPGCAP